MTMTCFVHELLFLSESPQSPGFRTHDISGLDSKNSMPITISLPWMCTSFDLSRSCAESSAYTVMSARGGGYIGGLVVAIGSV